MNPSRYRALPSIVGRCVPRAAALALVPTILLTACGGGSDDDGAAAASSDPPRLIALAAVDGGGEGAATPRVTQLTLQREIRVSRTLVEQVYRLTVINGATSQSGLVVQLQAAGDGVTIVDGTAAIGDLAAHATVTATDTITLRRDRHIPLDTGALRWRLVDGAVIGRIADGYLQGAQVFWDCNNNFRIDVDESWAESGAGGRYVLPAAPSAACRLRADVPSWAYDEGTRKTVGSPMFMSAMPGQPGFISPLTTLAADAGFDAAELRSRFNITAPAHEDYVAQGKAGLATANKAQLLAATLQNVYGVIQSSDDAGRAKAVRKYLEYYPPGAFDVPGDARLSNAQLALVLDGLPSFTLASVESAPTPGHRFVLRDPTRSGLCGTGVFKELCEQRKTVLRGAIGLVERYGAARGSAIDWSVIPAAERRALGVADVMPSNARVDELRQSLQGLARQQDELTSEALRTVRSAMKADLVDRSTDLLADWADAVVTFADPPVLKKINDKLTYKKLKKALTDLGKAKPFLQALGVGVKCTAVLGNDLADTLEDDKAFVKVDKFSTLALDILACWGDIAGNRRFKKVLAAASGFRGVVFDGADVLAERDQQLQLLKAVSALIQVGVSAAEVMDAPGRVIGVAKGVALLLDGRIHGLEFGIDADKALALFASDLETQRKLFKTQVLDGYAVYLFEARVQPYIVSDVLAELESRPYFVTAPTMQALAYTRRAPRPAAAAVADALQSAVGEELQFGLSAEAMDADGRQAVWNFGDGSPTLTVDGGLAVTHAFRSPGTYTVTVELTSRTSPLWYEPETTSTHGAQQETTVVVEAQTVAPQSRLPDTGATLCLRNGLALLTECTSTDALALSNRQDGQVGRDATDASAADGRNGFSYAEVPGFTREECIVDRTTGLMWEGKTASGPRAGTRTFANLVPDVRDYVAEVNAAGLCGHRDWRLPEIDELLGLFDYGHRPRPPATLVWPVHPWLPDPVWFPNSVADTSVQGTSPWRDEWVTTPCIHPAGQCTWKLRNDGSLLMGFYGSSHARLVRGGASPSPRHAVSIDGQEVLDRRTGLVWSRCLEGMQWSLDLGTCTGTALLFDRDDAFQRASSRAAASGRDWRLPNIKELSSIAERTLSLPALDLAVFAAAWPPAMWLWSSTPELTTSTVVRTLAMDTQRGGLEPRTRLNQSSGLRLVRGGEDPQLAPPLR